MNVNEYSPQQYFINVKAG